MEPRPLLFAIHLASYCCFANPQATPTASPTAVHRMTGTVVRASDGSVVADANVALARQKDAFVLLGPGANLTVAGPAEGTFLFLAEPNGLSAVQAKSNDKGEFVLEQFCEPEQDYSLVVSHPDLAPVIRTLKPSEAIGKSLRIQMEAASFVRTPKKANLDPRQNLWIRCDVTVPDEETGLEADLTRANVGPPDRDFRPFFKNVLIGGTYYWGPNQDELHVGPLPDGYSLRLILSAGYFYRRKFLSKDHMPVLADRTVYVSKCRSIDLCPAVDDGISLSGAITGEKRIPLPGVNVIARPVDRRSERYGAVTDAEGRYVIQGLRAGTYDIDLRRFSPGSGVRDVSHQQELTLPSGQDLKRDFENVRVFGAFCGRPAPQLEGTTLSGRRFRLSELQGKAVMIHFWALEHDSSSELREVARHYENHRDFGLELMTVCLSRDLSTARHHIERNKVDPDMVISAANRSDYLMMEWGISALPASFIVNAEGDLAHRDFRGEDIEAAMRSATLPNRLLRDEEEDLRLDPS